jgi:outer membrane protein
MKTKTPLIPTGDRLAPALTRGIRVLLLVSAAALTAPVLVAPASGQTQRPAAAPDTSTHILSLGDAARLAARQSTSALTSHSEAVQSAARTRKTFGSFLPTVYGQGQETGMTINSATLLVFPPGTPSLGLVFPPNGIVLPQILAIDFHAYGYDTLFSYATLQRYRQAKMAEAAYYAAATSTSVEAATVAARAYLNVQHDDAIVGARLADSTLASDLLTIARQQLSAGVGIGLDVTRAQSQLASARAQLISARGARDRANLDLLHALGLSLDARLVLTDSLSRLPVNEQPPAEPDAVELALRDRPDLRAIDQQLAAAEQQISAVRAERAPTLAAYGGVGVSGANWDRMLHTYNWGIGLSVPAFDGLRRESRIQEQQAAANEISIKRRDLRQQAAIEVRGALLDLETAREELNATNQQLQFSQQELDQARERFRTGVAGNADVVTASQGLNDARTLEINALTAYQNARVALARAIGNVTALP